MLTGTYQSHWDAIYFGSRHPSTRTYHGAQTRPEPPFRPFTGMRRPVNRETGRNPLHVVGIPRSDRMTTPIETYDPTLALPRVGFCTDVDLVIFIFKCAV